MIRRPPRSTPFPTRRSSDLGNQRLRADFPGLMPDQDSVAHVQVQSRSEEHTSELQSPCNLVCRLLLEKKKKNNYSFNNKHIEPIEIIYSIHLYNSITCIVVA